MSLLIDGRSLPVETIAGWPPESRLLWTIAGWSRSESLCTSSSCPELGEWAVGEERHKLVWAPKLDTQCVAFSSVQGKMYPHLGRQKGPPRECWGVWKSFSSVLDLGAIPLLPSLMIGHLFPGLIPLEAKPGLEPLRFCCSKTGSLELVRLMEHAFFL